MSCDLKFRPHHRATLESRQPLQWWFTGWRSTDVHRHQNCSFHVCIHNMYVCIHNNILMAFSCLVTAVNCRLPVNISSWSVFIGCNLVVVTQWLTDSSNWRDVYKVNTEVWITSGISRKEPGDSSIGFSHSKLEFILETEISNGHFDWLVARPTKIGAKVLGRIYGSV